MFNRVLGDPQEIPVPLNKRSYTDCICCVATTVFALALFVLAVIAYTGSGTKSTHYFQIPQPLVSDNRQDITQSTFNSFQKVIFWTSILSLGIGLLWLAIVHLAQVHAPRFALILGFLACVAIGVFSLFVKNRVFESYSWFRYLWAGLAFFTALVLLFYQIMYTNELRFQGIFLKYAVRFLNQRPANFWYLLVFLLLTCGLVALCLFQHLAFSRKHYTNNNLYDFSNPGVFGILNIVQFFWGLKFLQDAFIFIISGNAADWYWRRDGQEEPCLGLKNLLCRNWGSVVAGSLLNLIFKLPFILLELLVCHPTGCCNRCGNSCYDSCWHRLINLVRTDSYAFTNLFGTAYCDSSRHCQNLCLDYPHFQGSQSPLRNYRVAVQVFLTAVGFIGSYVILNHWVSDLRGWFVAEVIILVTAITYYFGSLHASAAEGLQISFMVENQLTGGYEYMQLCLPSVRKELQLLSRRASRDGNC